MRLASVNVRGATPSRDGTLAVVSEDGQKLALAPRDRFPSMLAVLDRWADSEPELRAIDKAVRTGAWKDLVLVKDASFRAPLPRTWAFLDGSAFVQHVILVRKARGAEPPEDLLKVPLMYQGASDNLLGPHDEIPLVDETHGMDFESEVAIVTDFVPCGTKASDAARHVKLVLLVNDVSLRELIPKELATGFGFFHGKPPSSFSPFAVTPDELGPAWRDGRVHLPLETRLNGEWFGSPNAGEMHFSFYDLIEHAARTRPLSAGTIIGSGTVSNKDEAVGSSCLVERRMLEKIKQGVISTPYLKAGDHIEIRMRDGDKDLFGAISQRVRQGYS